MIPTALYTRFPDPSPVRGERLQLGAPGQFPNVRATFGDYRSPGDVVVRHVVLLRFKPETPAADKQSLRDGLSELKTAVPEIRRYEFGDDLELADGNFDFAVMAEFNSSADFKIYAAHPRHQQLIAELIRPILAERVALQYEF